MGRYSGANLESRLEVKPVEGQEKIDKEKEKINDRTPEGLAREYRKHRDIKERLDEESKQNGLRLHAIEQLMDDAFTDAGINSISLVGGGTIRIQKTPHAVIEDQVALCNWAVENGYGDAISPPTVPWQTANSWAKERFLLADDDNPIPAGITLWLRITPYLTR